VESSSDNDGTGRHHQTTRVRQARREGVTRVNQRQNPLKGSAGSNLVDMGREAVHADQEQVGDSVVGVETAGLEAVGKVCGVPTAMLQGQSWAPPPSTGWW
jgi:hypothetical protein